MGRFGAGQGIRRVEDARFLTGTGRYTDDIVLPGQVHGVVVRSPYAHGILTGVDTDDARAMPGVLGVFTAADLEAAGLGPIPIEMAVKNRDGSPMGAPERPTLARDRVRYAGEPVAFVVAETVHAARDAAEAVMLDVEPLDAVPDITAALAEGAPVLHPEVAPGNILFDWEMGDPAATEAAFAGAARVVTLDLVNSRLSPTFMEPRGAIGHFDTATDRYELYTGSQGSHNLRETLAKAVFHLPEERFRVVCPDVGGGFGTRLFVMSEHVLVLFAAKALGRPVKWIAERTEGFASDLHARDHRTRAELALDDTGRFLALRVDIRANMGAFCSQFGAFIPTSAGAAMSVGVYTIGTATVRSRGVMTNTVGTDAYRGAGRPEAAYMLERLIDVAAAETGVARDAIRRRNFIPPEALPYTSALGHVYDSGDFAAILDRAMAKADWAAGFEARRAVRAAAGRLRGIGLSYYVEACGGGRNFSEPATVQVAADGTVTVLIGTQSTGQGHETAYAQMAAAALGVPVETIRVRQGDTDEVKTGKGTGGSRSIPSGGASVVAAAATLIRRAKAVAAHLLEADGPDAIDHDPDTGLFRRPGSNRVLHLAEIAEAAKDPANRPPDLADQPGLVATEAYVSTHFTFPNGCHVCEVEVDPETGTTHIERYTIVDDMGVVLNPRLLEGQIIGGTVQGLSQALMEEIVYDPESGQLVTGTFQDYAVPHAGGIPDFSFEAVEDYPCRTNPLGVKGAGEAGTVGAAPAVINAVVDALAPLGIRHLDMPATPHRVWQAIQAARQETA
ncbi:xanthine dehydrogenase family protein molybdopterin-binding subunit [Roseospira marina]|uniref:Xanthine dehydrogenase family protein molybdopterin-binding subunit n=1 Tax=Roseospira marina TaxID=140057 RepID=A0A5M6IDY9_9PROT|nr:xanthine dehydrogenase family protein molybdopterin-binding subunit [Roseospira marina]KAA5605935.1 xanthine dehydrogenase family protein molybdopterin-binding subunit [Roseospira marina]MBB4313222.1 carbon-monoxide dehydrogenase large subunit [Roseospira marina]MBB5086037.1 carbon-monoxide dehydrogenase large subunit [Roseospira marina]